MAREKSIGLTIESNLRVYEMMEADLKARV